MLNAGSLVGLEIRSNKTWPIHQPCFSRINLVRSYVTAVSIYHISDLLSKGRARVDFRALSGMMRSN